MKFQRRGGRKRIVGPDGSEIVPTSKPQPDGTLIKAQARAWRWQELIDESVYISVPVLLGQSGSAVDACRRAAPPAAVSASREPVADLKPGGQCAVGAPPDAF